MFQQAKQRGWRIAEDEHFLPGSCTAISTAAIERVIPGFAPRAPPAGR